MVLLDAPGAGYSDSSVVASPYTPLALHTHTTSVEDAPDARGGEAMHRSLRLLRFVHQRLSLTVNLDYQKLNGFAGAQVPGLHRCADWLLVHLARLEYLA